MHADMADPSDDAMSFFERMRDCSAAGFHQGPHNKHRRSIRRSLSASKLSSASTGAITYSIYGKECPGDSGLFLPAGNFNVAKYSATNVHSRDATEHASQHRDSSSWQRCDSIISSPQQTINAAPETARRSRSSVALDVQDRLDGSYNSPQKQDPPLAARVMKLTVTDTKNDDTFYDDLKSEPMISLSPPPPGDYSPPSSSPGPDDPSQNHQGPSDDVAAARRVQENCRRFKCPLRLSRQLGSCKNMNLPVTSNIPVISLDQEDSMTHLLPLTRPFESRYVVDSSSAIGVGTFSRVLKVFERRRSKDDNNVVLVKDFNSRTPMACKVVQLMLPSESFAEATPRLIKNFDDNDPRARDRVIYAGSSALSSSRAALLEEVRMLKLFSEHPSFLQFKEVSFSDCGRMCYIVTEFAHGGDLSRFLEDRRGRRITEQEVRQVVLCVLEGLAHMHERGIAHRDLKLENILILSDTGNLNRVVIGDLGMAKRLDAGSPPMDHQQQQQTRCSDDSDGIIIISSAGCNTGGDAETTVSPMLTADNASASDDNEADVAVSHTEILAGRRTRERHSICGNPMHMAPEMLQQPTRTSKECQSQYRDDIGCDSSAVRGCRVEYDVKVDIWACGVLMYRLLSGEYPFQPSSSSLDGKTVESHDSKFDGEIVELFRAIKTGKYSLSGTVWDDASDSGKDLLQKLLAYDAEKRPSAREAINHPWFAENL